MQITKALNRLEYLCNTIPPLLRTMDQHVLNEKQHLDKWSKKEIIGHLVDSAANNHQRFVRAQFEDKPDISYDQDKWNKYNYYGQINAETIISLWTAYNKQLVELMARIPANHLRRECKLGEKSVTLAFLISDYVEHMEHHLGQLINY